MNLLNVGCGHHFHPAWVNIDLAPVSSNVIPFDILKPLPFPDVHFDAVYHSHLIEHLEPESVNQLLKEAYRVLKPNGIMRVVTPDLETIARIYLEKLAAAQKGVPNAALDYEWIVLELFDQIARTIPGGEMQKYLLKGDLENKDFIISRIGREFEERSPSSNASSGNSQKLLGGLRRITLQSLTRCARERVAYFCTKIIAGKYASKALITGLFRRSGEIHYRLYDRYSLSVLLEKQGFVYVHVCQPEESAIPNFADYSLDVINGMVRKPDSLFVEGRKP